MKRIVMIIMAVALIALPTMAQDWQSTSSMQGTGSNYAPQVTAVGATGVSDMATTTESYTPARGPRRAKMDGDGYSSGLDGFDDDAPEYGQGPSPIGDAVLPMLLCAAVFCGVIALRRRREALKR